MTATSSFERDYATLTGGCGLLDNSERGKLALSGPDAKELLHGQVTNDILALRPGSGTYAALLTPKGKMLGDLRVLDAGEELLLDTERVALQALFNVLRRYSLGHQAELHKRTVECALLSLLGPDADAVLLAAAALPESALPDSPLPDSADLPSALPHGAPTATEHAHATGRIGRTDVRAIRTDAGIDLLLDSDALDDVRAALLATGAHEVRDEAAECVRIEHGRPRYGVDLDDTVIPQEAGLNARAVSFTKGCYVGQETVARLFYKGKPNRELRGLRAAKPLTAGTVASFAERPVATVTSAAVSPRLGPIGLALVRREAPPGSVAHTEQGTAVEIVELPFA